MSLVEPVSLAFVFMDLSVIRTDTTTIGSNILWCPLKGVNKRVKCFSVIHVTKMFNAQQLELVSYPESKIKNCK